MKLTEIKLLRKVIVKNKFLNSADFFSMGPKSTGEAVLDERFLG